MASDGVVDGSEGIRAAVEVLCRRTTNEPLDIAAALLSETKGRFACRDDMTVAVVCINPPKEE